MKKYTILVACMLLLASCVQEVKFDAEKTVPDTIVVSGDFTNSHDVHRVFITRPNSYGSAKFKSVTDARVWIVDETGARAEYIAKYQQDVLDPEFCYELPAGAATGSPGKSYYLEIQLADGRLYRSRPAAMPDEVKSDSIQATGVLYNSGISGTAGPETAYVTLDLHSKIPSDNQTYYLRWDVFRAYHFQEFYRDPTPPKTQTFCFVHDFFNRQIIHVEKFEGVGGKHIVAKLATREIDKTYAVINYFTATQHSITADAYRYWEDIQLVANPDGTIFDAPPSPIRGNIYNVNNPDEIPLGYFEVAAVDTMRYRLVTTSLGQGFAAPSYCVFSPPFYNYPGDECECCLMLPLSKYERPWYWVE